MGFWNTFFKIWQIRLSIKAQEAIEDSYIRGREQAKTKANLPKITEELEKKNSLWNEKIDESRNKLK